MVVALIIGVGSMVDGGLVEAGGSVVGVGGLMVFLVAVDNGVKIVNWKKKKVKLLFF